MQIAIINGPNLNLLGKRETNIYGNEDFNVFYAQLKSQYTQLELSYYQSNSEGQIVSKIQELGFGVDGIILNPAAYSHTSIAIRDAISSIKVPVLEVHISNIFSNSYLMSDDFFNKTAYFVNLSLIHISEPTRPY